MRALTTNSQGVLDSSGGDIGRRNRSHHKGVHQVVRAHCPRLSSVFGNEGIAGQLVPGRLWLRLLLVLVLILLLLLGSCTLRCEGVGWQFGRGGDLLLLRCLLLV